MDSISKRLENKPTLYVIEGFDRIGKDTLLTDLQEQGLMDTYKLDSSNMPPYRHANDFIKSLHVFLQHQVKDLRKLAREGKDIVMARLEISDYVYSKLFGREMICDKYADQIAREFIITNIVLLWKDYGEYVKRCEILAGKKLAPSELEYSEEEFNKICKLYKECPETDYLIDYVTANTTREEMLDIVQDVIAWNRHDIDYNVISI